MDNMIEHKAGKGSYGYSGTRIDPADFGTTRMTLFTLIIDRSGSMIGYQTEVENCIQNIINGCKQGPMPENIMVRVVDFGSNLNEIHGFKFLTDIGDDDYSGKIRISGNTALCDAFENGISSILDYGKAMKDQDFDVNGIIAVVTDGYENGSTLTERDVKKALMEALKGESLESLLTILVGVGMSDDPNDANTKQLSYFQSETGISQFEKLKDLTPESWAKLGRFISKNVSSQSVSLGSGAASAPITI